MATSCQDLLGPDFLVASSVQFIYVLATAKYDRESHQPRRLYVFRLITWAMHKP